MDDCPRFVGAQKNKLLLHKNVSELESRYSLWSPNDEASFFDCFYHWFFAFLRLVFGVSFWFHSWSVRSFFTQTCSEMLSLCRPQTERLNWTSKREKAMVNIIVRKGMSPVPGAVPFWLLLALVSRVLRSIWVALFGYKEETAFRDTPGMAVRNSS